MGIQQDQEIVDEQLLNLVQFCESGAAQARRVPQMLCNLVIGLDKEKIAEEEEKQANEAMRMMEGPLSRKERTPEYDILSSVRLAAAREKAARERGLLSQLRRQSKSLLG